MKELLALGEGVKAIGRRKEKEEALAAGRCTLPGEQRSVERGGVEVEVGTEENLENRRAG